MPTKIHQYRGGARDQERKRRRSLYLTKGVTVTAPFLGYCPDLPINVGGWQLARNILNTVPVSRERRGQFLTHEDGYVLANNNAVIAVGESTGTYSKFGLFGGAITGLGSFTTGAGAPTSSTQNMVIYNTGLGSSDVGISRRTGTGVWSAVIEDNNASAITTSSLDTRFDTAVYAFGAPTRTYTDTADGGNHSGITVPVYIMAGGDETGPTIPVLINPDSDGSYGQYSELWEPAFVGDLTIPNPLAHPFMAKSVETWDGRVLFFNTREGGVHYPGRLRGSAIGTCDPSNEEIGSFRVDFKGFQKQGMRVESIGDQIACYFEDGTVLVQRTGRFTDPVRWRTVSETRGLLSTQSLTPISNSQHFGVFSDGWWLLDAGGRWTPVGTIEVPESGDKDAIFYKWRETFRILLDIERKHYITTSYDPIRRRVRVSFPIRGQDHPQFTDGRPLLETWVYDVDTDTVWPLGHDIDVTVWSSFDQLIKSAETYGDYPTTPYGDVTVARREYGSYNALFGLAHPSHGDNLNCAYTWDPDIYTRDYPRIEDGSIQTIFERVTPAAYYHTHGISVTENPNERQVLRRVDVEYLNMDGPGVDVTAVNNSDVGVTTSVDTREGALGQIHTGHGTYQHGGTHHELQFSMRAPFAIRSFRPAFTQSDNEGVVSSG